MTYQYGLPVFGTQQASTRSTARFRGSRVIRRWTWLGDGPDPELAGRDALGVSRSAGRRRCPIKGQFFTLGGGDTSAASTSRERQGSITWVGSVEWRLPVFRHA